MASVLSNFQLKRDIVLMPGENPEFSDQISALVDRYNIILVLPGIYKVSQVTLDNIKVTDSVEYLKNKIHRAMMQYSVMVYAQFLDNTEICIKDRMTGMGNIGKLQRRTTPLLITNQDENILHWKELL